MNHKPHAMTSGEACFLRFLGGRSTLDNRRLDGWMNRIPTCAIPLGIFSVTKNAFDVLHQRLVFAPLHAYTPAVSVGHIDVVCHVEQQLVSERDHTRIRARPADVRRRSVQSHEATARRVTYQCSRHSARHAWCTSELRYAVAGYLQRPSGLNLASKSPHVYLHPRQ